MKLIQQLFAALAESRFPKRKSNEYEEEYGLILYNAT